MKLQTNKITKQAYEGSNQATLISVKEERGYKSDEWITFVQNRDILKGKLVNAKGQGIILGRPVDYSEKTEDGKVKDFKGMKKFCVFNCDLVEVENDNK